MSGIDYSQVCFVIMPFGTKKVGDHDVDFDFIFKNVFEPAVNATPLNEGGGRTLVAKRTDKDFFTGDISQEMFEYLDAPVKRLGFDLLWRPESLSPALKALIRTTEARARPIAMVAA